MSEELKELQKLTEQQGVYNRLQEEGTREAIERLSLARTLSRTLDEELGISRRRTLEEKELLKIVKSLNDSANANLELSRKLKILDKEKFNLRIKQSKIENEIALARATVEADAIAYAEDVAKYRNSAAGLEGDILKLRLAILEAEEQGANLTEDARIQQEAVLENLKAQLAEKDAAANNDLEKAKDLESYIDSEGKHLAILLQMRSISKEQLEDIEKRIVLQREVNKITGITGELLEGLNRIGLRVFGGLGINLGVISQAFDDGREAMEKFATKAATADKKVPFARTQALLKGTKAFLGNIPGLLTDPAVVIGAMASNFKDVNSASVDFQRIVGSTAPLIDANFNMKLITSTQYFGTLLALSERFSLNMQGAIPASILQRATELQNTMGLTAEQSGQLAIISSLTNNTVNSTLDSIVGQVSAYNKTNRTALNHGQILRDIANTSEDILASLAAQPDALGKSAAAARRLGMELKGVDAIASSLLQFETSIENELQGQLLTGKEINLALARQYALNNQLDKVGDEIFKNTVDVAEFATMNRIAQEGLAQALGISRQDLAKIALQRSAEGSMTSQILEDAAGITRQDIERAKANEALLISVQKIGQALAGPVELLARMLDHTQVMYGVLGLIATQALVSLYTKLKAGFGVVLGTLGGQKATTKEQIKQTIATEATNKGLTKTVGLITAAAVKAKALATSLAAAATASNAINPAFPGANVGRGALGRFTSLKPTAGSGLLRGAGVASMFGPKGWIIAGILAALAAGGYAISKMRQVDDGVIDPKGGLIISGPKGSIQTNPSDYIVASTRNPMSGNDALLRKLDELTSVLKQGGDVYLDGNRVGRTMVMGSYKNS